MGSPQKPSAAKQVAEKDAEIAALHELKQRQEAQVAAWLHDIKRAEAERERDRYHDALIARHGGEPIALLAELDEARREIAALRKDAERYRYQFSTGAWDYHYDWIDEPKPYVDADIDAAIAAQSPRPSAAEANSDKENVRE